MHKQFSVFSIKIPGKDTFVNFCVFAKNKKNIINKSNLSSCLSPSEIRRGSGEIEICNEPMYKYSEMFEKLSCIK